MHVMRSAIITNVSSWEYYISGDTVWFSVLAGACMSVGFFGFML